MKVLLIEDELKVAESVKAFLEDAQIIVHCAFDGATGLQMAQKNEYDVIVSDIIMPQLNGIELCKKIRNDHITTPILLLSALYQPEDKVLGLESGADDYLSKPFDLRELLARIQALVRRAQNSPSVSNKLVFQDLEMHLQTLEVWRSNEKIILTPREFALLTYLVRNQGRVISKTELLEQVWNIDEQINTNVIEVYIGYIRNKVDKKFEKKLIHTHHGVGYIVKE